MDILLYSFIAHLKKKLGSEFRKFRRGKGGMNFCLGRGCLLNLMGAEGSFGNGDLEDVCMGYLLLG